MISETIDINVFLLIIFTIIISAFWFAIVFQEAATQHEAETRHEEIEMRRKLKERIKERKENMTARQKR